MDARDALSGEEAFEAFIDRWYGSSVRLARLLGADEETARHSARAAWLAVIERLDAVDEPLQLVVLRATVERLAARFEAGDAQPVLAADRFEAEGHRWAGWWRDERTPESRGRSPEDEALERALASLEPAEAAVVALRDVGGLSADEVERVLELTPEDQQSLLQRGRAGLWEKLA